jgi:CHAT domain
MNARTPVINASGDFEENLERLAKQLKKDKMRRDILAVVYGRGSKLKSKKQIADALGITGSLQPLQNALEYMANHHLLLRLPNDGVVDDRSRHVYGKDEFVRIHREKIVALADDRTKLEKLATKRSGNISVEITPKVVTKRELKRRKRLTVLYLFANPDPDPDPDKYIRPEAEARQVIEAIRSSKFRDNVSIEMRPAAGLQTVQDGLNDHEPEVVHFSGHSNSTGIAADNGKIGKSATEFISFDLLADALTAMDKRPTIVVFNSCFSAAARQKMLKAVPFMLGMADSVSDFAAIAFARRFYTALASGASIRSAYDQGVVAVSAVSLGEKETVKLFEREGHDSSKTSLT